MDKYIKVCGCIATTVTTIVTVVAGSWITKTVVDDIKANRKKSNSSEET